MKLAYFFNKLNNSRELVNIDDIISGKVSEDFLIDGRCPCCGEKIYKKVGAIKAAHFACSHISGCDFIKDMKHKTKWFTKDTIININNILYSEKDIKEHHKVYDIETNEEKNNIPTEDNNPTDYIEDFEKQYKTTSINNVKDLFYFGSKDPSVLIDIEQNITYNQVLIKNRDVIDGNINNLKGIKLVTARRIRKSSLPSELLRDFKGFLFLTDESFNYNCCLKTIYIAVKFKNTTALKDFKEKLFNQQIEYKRILLIGNWEAKLFNENIVLYATLGSYSYGFIGGKEVC